MLKYKLEGEFENQKHIRVILVNRLILRPFKMLVGIYVGSQITP